MAIHSGTVFGSPRTTTTVPSRERPSAARPSAARPQTDQIPARTRLRLTRRGRLVFGTLGVLIALAFALLLPLAAAPAVAGDEAAEPLQVITVEQGQSLWAIAEQIAPHADPREVITDILRLNGLDSAELVPGQQLALPADR
ncbi:LysM peptidoglycan-binding domain-containing protein [Agromyces sp. SYSU T00194]|uniref:LysM peptidoglycan-binding domain-containing protein n=1 Tax=Agromyces chitinivorans TaxID=3158560 RepID=UPI00339AD6FB